ncbi:hypothetical protein BU16DRAFT_81018 [Lophium mytilinum]|uniref:Uncharacterized protein n=1 Tax=Lophium mytilinum TaxID=390894 RepID=A0A6A6QM75_9PEZI|nr:hypothetical protein BU16DRAFT_81018 [Lophium mytilinum]
MKRALLEYKRGSPSQAPPSLLHSTFCACWGPIEKSKLTSAGPIKRATTLCAWGRAPHSQRLHLGVEHPKWHRENNSLNTLLIVLSTSLSPAQYTFYSSKRPIVSQYTLQNNRMAWSISSRPHVDFPISFLLPSTS